MRIFSWSIVELRQGDCVASLVGDVPEGVPVSATDRDGTGNFTDTGVVSLGGGTASAESAWWIGCIGSVPQPLAGIGPPPIDSP